MWYRVCRKWSKTGTVVSLSCVSLNNNLTNIGYLLPYHHYTDVTQEVIFSRAHIHTHAHSSSLLVVVVYADPSSLFVSFHYTFCFPLFRILSHCTTKHTRTHIYTTLPQLSIHCRLSFDCVVGTTFILGWMQQKKLIKTRAFFSFAAFRNEINSIIQNSSINSSLPLPFQYRRRDGEDHFKRKR